MKAPEHNAFATAEECAKWLESINHIEGSYATSNGADWIRSLSSMLDLAMEILAVQQEEEA